MTSSSPLQGTSGLSAEELRAIREQIDAAHEEVARICEGRWHGTGDWRTSIPARRDYDTDCILAHALNGARTMADEIDRLRTLTREPSAAVIEAVRQFGHDNRGCDERWVAEQAVRLAYNIALLEKNV